MLQAPINEELGVVLQVPIFVRNHVIASVRELGMSRHRAHFIGKTARPRRVSIRCRATPSSQFERVGGKT